MRERRQDSLKEHDASRIQEERFFSTPKLLRENVETTGGKMKNSAPEILCVISLRRIC